MVTRHTEPPSKREGMKERKKEGRKEGRKERKKDSVAVDKGQGHTERLSKNQSGLALA
jgi:hypothetical protein